MRTRFCLRQIVTNKDKRKLFPWTNISACVLFIISISMKGQCNKAEMFNNNIQNYSSSPSNPEVLANTLNSFPNKKGTEFDQSNTTADNSSINVEELDFEEETQSNKPLTDSSISDSIENALLHEPDYEPSHSTSSLPDFTADQQLESIEDDEFENEDAGIASPTREMESFDDEEDTSAKSSAPFAYKHKIHKGRKAVVTYSPYVTQIGNVKSTVSSTPITTANKFALSRSTPRSSQNKYPILKKVPTRLVAVSSYEPKSTTTKTPKKKVTTDTTKKPMKVTKPSRPVTFGPHHHHNPHHPHGVVVFDKRKKRPKPGRHKTKHTTTTTTSTAKPTTTTSTAFPIASEELYDYYWSSGENHESNEISGQNSTSSNSTYNKKRISSKIPLSKLAMAMIASSTIFDNSTGSDGALYYPKTPVNLLNILQTYTKQLQLANAQSTVKRPVVQIQSAPFLLQLSQLPFGTRIAISVYYSLIAIIPLVYLAFGGLGRLGFLNAFAGRGFGHRRRRRRRSYEDDQFALNGRYRTTVLQRADLDERNEDEYMWILGRISEIILEFSLLSDEKGY